MLLYLDTSALVPLLVGEASTPLCSRLWNDATTVVSSVVLHTEAAAACGQAQRMGRITKPQLGRSLSVLSDLIAQVSLVIVDDRLARRAAELSVSLGLRGYDAIHPATFELVAAPEAHMDDTEPRDAAGASADAALLGAWRALRLVTIDTARADRSLDEP